MTNFTIFPAPLRRVLAAVFVAAALGTPALAGAESDPSAPSVPVLVILPFTSGGGLGEPGKLGPVNVQFTKGLTLYLADAAKGRYTVASQASAERHARSVFTLKGEVSHIETAGKNGGPYFVTLQLFQADPGPAKTMHLRREWAGVARNVFALSNDVDNDDSVDKEGLQGELGKRIDSAVTTAPASGQAQKFAAFVASGTTKRFDTTVVSDPQLPGPKNSDITFNSGERFFFKVASQDAGDVYVVSLDSQNAPHAVFVPQDGHEINVMPQHPVTVPSESIQVGDVQAATDRKYIVLVRHGNTGETARHMGYWGNAARGTRSEGIFRLAAYDPQRETPGSGSPSVQVIDTGGPAAGPAPEPDDADVARLLTLGATDPPGTWLVQTVTVHVLPKKETNQ